MSSAPLQELRHEAKPGFLHIFEVVFATMCFYLAIIFIVGSGLLKKDSVPNSPGSPTAATPESPA